MTDQQALEVIRLRRRLDELEGGPGREEPAVVLDALRQLGEYLDSAQLRAEHRRWERRLTPARLPPPPFGY